MIHFYETCNCLVVFLSAKQMVVDDDAALIVTYLTCIIIKKLL